MNYFLLVGLAIGVAGGCLVGWLLGRAGQTRLEIELEKDRAAHGERLKTYQESETRLRDAFRALTAEALRNNNEQFLSLAETKLQQVRTEAAADIDGRRKAIEDLLGPMQKTLAEVDREIKESERRRIEMGAMLAEKIVALDTVGQDLRGETQRLVDALKRPGVRGRWGELQLKRVVELAGMVEHCDFEEQPTLAAPGSLSPLRPVSGDERRVRPDVVVHLPGGKHIVIDAKVPLDAYLRTLEARDDAERQALLTDHARQVRTHITQLAAKAYAEYVQPSPDFVVMFLPGEMFLSAALEQDPTLIEFGAVGNARRVIPASPTTLIALLRAVAYGWQQQAIEENARTISELGKNLYDAVRVLGSHFGTLGARLQSSLEAYNHAVGSLEANVLVKARKFKDLQAANGGEEIKLLEPIDRVPRMLQAAELTDGLPFYDVEGDVEKV